MTLIRRPMERHPIPMRSAIERLLSDLPPSFTDGGFGEMAPALDVRDAGDAYVVETELPGVNPDDVEVLIEGRTLTIKGRFAEDREEDSGNYLLRERRRGQFMRAVALPGMVEVDQVKSKFEDGELTITLPKAEQNRARRVQIEGGKRHNGGSKAQSGGRAQKG
jgi:HSP20 family protein